MSDVAFIDAFEKIRAYLLEREPGLEQDALARPADATAWQRRSARECQEAFVAAVLGIDRRTAAGRRAARQSLQTIRERVQAGGGQVADAPSGSSRTDLVRPDACERLVREKGRAVAEALEALAATDDGSAVALLGALGACESRRETLRVLRKSLPLLGGLRAYEFLRRIGYPIVAPDPARQRLVHRLGWLEQVTPAVRYPQAFFEICERLVHLTGEAWAVLDAALGLFAGARGERVSAAEPLAVCTRKPRCATCVLRGQCAYFRYRGEPVPARSRSVKQMAYAEQPRTRFETIGAANLSETELLALVLRTGYAGGSSLDLAREIIERFGSLEAIHRAGVGELCELKGVGRAKAIELKAALELGRRLQGGSVAIGEQIRRSADLYAIYRVLLAHEQQENFYLVVLNSRNRIQSQFLISRGSLASSPVHPREVMKVAIREAAAGIVFVHNHPSGEPDPSEDDLAITKRLCETANLVGIKVLDHIIVARDSYYSFADHRLLR